MLPLIPLDKANHYVYGQAVFVASYLTASLPLAGLGMWAKLGLAFGVVVGVAIGKEVRDKRTGKGTPDWRDAAWTMAGTAAPAAFLLAF